MGRLLKDFSPNTALFFDLFDRAAQNVAEMAVLLESFVNTKTACDQEVLYKQIDKMENIGDDITHKINLYLNKIVFTPINRNDIHVLASAIDDVADAIQEASGRIYLYNINEFIPPVKEISAITLQASVEISKAVSLLRSSKKRAAIPALCQKIKT